MSVSGDFEMDMIAPVFFEMIIFFKMVCPFASLNALDFSVQSQLEAEPMAKPPSQQVLNVVSHSVSHFIHHGLDGQPAMMEVLSRWYAVKVCNICNPHVHSSSIRSIQVGCAISMLFNSYKLLPSGHLT